MSQCQSGFFTWSISPLLFFSLSNLQQKKNVKVTHCNKHQISLLGWENLQLS